MRFQGVSALWRVWQSISELIKRIDTEDDAHAEADDSFLTWSGGASLGAATVGTILDLLGFGSDG